MISVLVFFFGGRHVGKLEAEFDLWRGRYEIHGYGLYMGAPYAIESLKPYGVEYRHVAGCLVNAFIMDSVATYNLTMLAAIKEDLGLEIDWPVLFYGDDVKNGKGMEGFEQDIPGNSKPGAGAIKNLMYTRKPEKGDGSFYEIDECFDVLPVDFDGDSEPEDLCLSYLNYRGYGEKFIHTSLVINLIHGFKYLLRQELNRSYYLEERFDSLEDLNADGRVELITHVRFSPDCAGCDAYRIYEFTHDRFNLKLCLFGIDPGNVLIRDVWQQLEEYNKTILTNLHRKNMSEYPCGLAENCIKSSPWLADTDHDGRLEIVMLVNAPKADFDPNDQASYLFFAETETSQYQLQPISLEFSVITNFLGFLKTRDKRIHLLITAADSGNSSAFPVLHIFDLHWPKITKIGEFSGFYEHAIAEGLRDLDGDGNTEIIHVGETYLRPDDAWSNIDISYDIAEYRDGNYVENNMKFKRSYEQINKQAVDPSLQAAPPLGQDSP